MKVDVYDTYAKSASGSILHFDVLVPNGTSEDAAFRFAREWLDKIGHTDAELKQSRCSFCHSENASVTVIADIQKDGYHILQMQGCPEPV